MEIGPGVFVAEAQAGGWEPDPDVGGEMRVLCAGVGVQAGLSRFIGADEHPPIEWVLPGRETALILEGSARIEVEGGPTLEVKAGDIFSLPGGVLTTWHITLPFREFWVIEE